MIVLLNSLKMNFKITYQTTKWWIDISSGQTVSEIKSISYRLLKRHYIEKNVSDNTFYITTNYCQQNEA